MHLLVDQLCIISSIKLMHDPHLFVVTCINLLCNWSIKGISAVMNVT